MAKCAFVRNSTDGRWYCSYLGVYLSESTCGKCDKFCSSMPVLKGNAPLEITFDKFVEYFPKSPFLSKLWKTRDL